MKRLIIPFLLAFVLAFPTAFLGSSPHNATVENSPLPAITTEFHSQGQYDGWILESSENSSQGGAINSQATTILLGDDHQNRQYRAILSFDTSGLPENIQITSAILKIRRQGISGTDPFTTHSQLLVDIRSSSPFGNKAALQGADFQNGANKGGIGVIPNAPVNNWYSSTLQAAAYPYINTGGLTQMRLRFKTDDNNDNGQDTFRFFSSNYDTANVHPTLSITYQPAPSGHVVYSLAGKIYRIAAQSSATPENISAALDVYDSGKADTWINISPDGNWLVIGSERFDARCDGWACMVILSSNLATRQVVLSSGEPIHADYAAVASGGARIVYVSDAGPHARDLWAITKQSETWGAPELLTENSTYEHNLLPAISNDGEKVVYSCSPTAYAQEGAAICEVNINGTGWQVALRPTDGPNGTSANSLRQPDYAPDGSIVFEADWSGEQIWRLPDGQTTPALVNPNHHNDNSPCILSNGKIASLWLGRAGNTAGLHELKIMAPNGSGLIVLLPNQDVTDIGLGCGD